MTEAEIGDAIIDILVVAEGPGFLLQAEREMLANARETLKPFIEAATRESLERMRAKGVRFG